MVGIVDQDHVRIIISVHFPSFQHQNNLTMLMTKGEYNEIKNLLSFACAFLTCRRKSYHHPEFRADKTFVQKNQPRPLQADSSCRWLWIIGRGSFWSHNNPLHFQCMHAMEQLCGKVLELGLQSVQKHLNNITSRAQNGLSDV